MNKPNKFLYTLSLVLIFSLLLTTGLPVRAAEAQAGPEVSTPFSNMICHLYRVAEKDLVGSWNLVPPFHIYALELSPDTDEGKRTLVEALAAYIIRDKVTPCQTVQADSTGKASFGKIPAGLYLITGDVSKDSSGCQLVPTILEWPAKRNTSPVRLKYEVLGQSGKTDELAVHVLKVWRDNQVPDRPKSIQVQLIQDDQVIDTATLNADNNWRKDWYFLPWGHNYHVIEKIVPAGYTLRVSRQGMTFTLTNTKGGEPKKLSPKLTPTGPKIPQTGQRWWPVALLALLGIGFSLKAYRISRFPKEGDQ